MAYGRREGSHIAGCHYLDGVPVKISEKFRPPRKITLPLSYQQRYPVDLLNDEYDFTLENQVLEMAEARRKISDVTKHVVPKDSKIPMNSVNWNNSSNNNNNNENPYTGNGNISETNSIQGENTVIPKNGFVMGVPSSILSSLEPNSMLKPVPSSSGPLASGKPDVTITSKLNLEDFEAESSPFDSIALKTLNDLEELESVLQNVNLNNSVISEVQSTPTTDMTGEISNILHTCNNNMTGKTEECPLYNIPEDSVSDLKNCHKSIALDSQQDLFPGPSPVAKDFPSIPSTNESDAKSCKLDIASQNADLKVNFELDEDLVRHIVDMGFPATRVERAVRAFSGDHKKIIDHLCMVHSFIEMGYSVEDAEMAVFSPVKTEVQVKEYLDIVIQLRDLGFDEKSIREALAQCNNDRDKALDLLLS